MKLIRRIVLSVAIVVQLAGAAAPAWALTQRPQIAITFDDAPILVTPLLTTLQEKDAVATFFLVGADAEAHPELARSLADAGMPIGNHSHDHAHFASASADDIRANLTQAQEAIETVTGVRPRWFRSPYLDWSPNYPSVLPQVGLTASWPTINPKDWAGVTPESIVATVTTQAQAGGVVILHDMTNRTNTIEALPGVIDGLRARGYDLCTLDDLGRGHIAGTIRGTGSVPLEGAAVAAYDAGGELRGAAVTGEDGRFRIAQLEPGIYRVGVECQGYADRFYGGASTLEGATGVTVAEDHTLDGADVTPPRDTSPPATELTGVPAGWTREPITFSLSATDDFSEQRMQTWYRLGGDDAVRFTAPVTVDREGATLLGYWSHDGVGNLESGHAVWLRIDATAPVTSSDAVAEYTGSAAITLSATDAHSGVASTHYRLDSSPVLDGTRVVVDTPGAHALHFWSADEAGNVEGENAVAFAVIAPTGLVLQKTQNVPVRKRTSATKTPSLTATLRRADSMKRPVAGQTVRLQMRRSGSPTWSTAATSRTGADGKAKFRLVLRTGYQYRAVFAGQADTYGASTSRPLLPLPKQLRRR